MHDTDTTNAALRLLAGLRGTPTPRELILMDDLARAIGHPEASPLEQARRAIADDERALTLLFEAAAEVPSAGPSD